MSVAQTPETSPPAPVSGPEEPKTTFLAVATVFAEAEVAWNPDIPASSMASAWTSAAPVASSALENGVATENSFATTWNSEVVAETGPWVPHSTSTSFWTWMPSRTETQTRTQSFITAEASRTPSLSAASMPQSPTESSPTTSTTEQPSTLYPPPSPSPSSLANAQQSKASSHNDSNNDLTLKVALPLLIIFVVLSILILAFLFIKKVRNQLGSLHVHQHHSQRRLRSRLCRFLGKYRPLGWYRDRQREREEGKRQSLYSAQRKRALWKAWRESGSGSRVAVAGGDVGQDLDQGQHQYQDVDLEAGRATTASQTTPFLAPTTTAAASARHDGGSRATLSVVHEDVAPRVLESTEGHGQEREDIELSTVSLKHGVSVSTLGSTRSNMSACSRAVSDVSAISNPSVHPGANLNSNVNSNTSYPNPNPITVETPSHLQKPPRQQHRSTSRSPSGSHQQPPPAQREAKTNQKTTRWPFGIGNITATSNTSSKKSNSSSTRSDRSRMTDESEPDPLPVGADSVRSKYRDSRSFSAPRYHAGEGEASSATAGVAPAIAISVVVAGTCGRGAASSGKGNTGAKDHETKNGQEHEGIDGERGGRILSGRTPGSLLGDESRSSSDGSGKSVHGSWSRYTVRNDGLF